MRGRHPRAVEWADLEAGRLPVARATTLQQHATDCDPCARTWARVAGAREAMREIAEATPARLRNDVVSAQIYWAASSEIRRRERVRDGHRGWTRRLVPVALAAAIVGSMAAVTWWAAHSSPGPVFAGAKPVVVPGAPTKEVIASPGAATPASPAAPLPAPLAGVVTLVQGEVSVDGVAVAADAQGVAGLVIRPGARIVTGKGRVAVQFGDRTGFVLEPQSRLDLAAFDARTVDLHVEGAVALEVEKRHADQKFVVRAGDRVVEVRGTIFRVAEKAGDLDVAVARGEVTVADAEARQIAVPAGQHLGVASSARVSASVPRPAPAAAGLAVPTLPNWSSAEESLQASALVVVSAPAGARVRVQGVDSGDGSFVMRAAPGRLLVESGGSSRWVDVEAGATVNATLPGQRSERPGQVDAQLRSHRLLISQCGAAQHNFDPATTGTLVVEIGVESDGAVGFVSSVGGDVGREVETCILGVIRDRFTFPTGTKATVQKNIRL